MVPGLKNPGFYFLTETKKTWYNARSLQQHLALYLLA